MDAEDQRRRGGRKQQKSARRGRRTTAEKIRQADRTENVLCEGVDLEDAKVAVHCAAINGDTIWRMG